MGRHMKPTRNQTEGNIHKSRKDLRKEQRKLKKAKRNEFFQRKKNKSKKPVSENTTREVPVTSIVNMPVSKVHDKRNVKKYSETERNQKLQIDMKNQRIRQLKKANQQEDKVIRKLEKQLKLNKKKRKSVPKSFAADGLDYLLEVCDQKDMENATVMDLMLHDSGAQFKEDLAMIRGKTQVNGIARRQTNILVKSSDDDDDDDDEEEVEDGEEVEDDEHVDNFESVKGMASEAKTSEEEFEEVVKFDDTDSSEFGIPIEQTDDVSLECDTETENHLEGNTKKVNSNNKMLHNSESDDTTENVVTKKSILKRKKNETETYSVVDPEGSKHSKRLLVCKRKLQNPVLTDGEERGDLGENHVRDSENENVKVMENLKMKTRKKTRDSMNIRRRFDEGLVHNVYDEDGDVDSICEKGVGDTVEGERGQVGELWEDIYGRTRDKQGNVIQAKSGKYVPPHARGSFQDQDTKKQEQLKRLRRQMKGLLNRLAENNMNSIALEIEKLYMSHSRNNMNESLTDLLFDSLVVPVLTPERLIMEHAMLVTILHANVGTEVGAHVLQLLVKKFHEHHQCKEEVENKQLDNITLILCHLYNFRVFSAVLMYDILEKLSERFEEKEVELILLILRSVGFSLRKDNPLALKELILRLQQMAGEATHCKNSTRVKFMLEVLLAIKNNNMAKIPNYDPSHSEHLKKLMKGFLHKGSYVTELRISLDDLLKADERGRWWVVGSAWTGPLPGKTDKQDSDTCTALQQTSVYTQQLLDLARKHRMNTDVRRSIFGILMTAEDYLDAFEKLLRLGLKSQQDREIIHVIINCCLQEKQFNPYYCCLSQKFCDFDRKYQIAIQCALWDRFKELKNMASFQVTNLAKFLVHLVIQKGLPLSVIKVINFAEVDRVTVRFLRQVLLGVLLTDSEDFQQAFQRITVSSKLRLFREGIRIFIHHFLLRNMSSLPRQDMDTLQVRAKMADKILSAAESKVKF